MDKGTRVEQAEEATRRLHSAGIRVGFFLQFGYPGETRKDIAATLQLVRNCRPDDIGMSVSYPLPGTKFHKAVSDQLGLQQNWLDSRDLAMMYQGPFGTAFYRQLHVVLHHEFRLHKAWSALRSRRRRLRSLAGMVYHGAALPLARFQLEILARVRHSGLTPLPRFMTPDAAARPTPQPDAATRS
jgi:anaerobic magnesium-protoporphyrin IX monomethyl ester cyclase